MRNSLPILFVGISFLIHPARTPQDNQRAVSTQLAAPIEGTVALRGGEQLRYQYHFDHNALADCVRIHDYLIALTTSGNLLRFDADSLQMTGQQIIPGRATAISVNDGKDVLVGTEDGQIVEVDPSTLAQTSVAKAPGEITWLTSAPSFNGKGRMIVAISDYQPEAFGWPGETDEQNEQQIARLRKSRHFSVAVYENGKRHFITVPIKSNLFVPRTFSLDGSNYIWMGMDKGEWGGALLRVDLRTGKVRTTEMGEGALGFIKPPKGPLIVYGGMSHLGGNGGYIASLESAKPNFLHEFESNEWQTPAQDKTRSPENMPQGPIDLIVEDTAEHGYWVVSANTLFHTDTDFSGWTKKMDLGGRWIAGRSLSMGNTPTVQKLILSESQPQAMTAVMERDGLEKVSPAGVKQFQFEGQLESSIVDIWNMSLGTVLLGDEFNHSAWRLLGDQWQRLAFHPRAASSDDNDDWDFTEPFGDDGSGIVAYCGDGNIPGEHALTRVSAEGHLNITESWKDSFTEFNSGFLMTSEGNYIGITTDLFDPSNNILRMREDSRWRAVGENSVPDFESAAAVPRGRRYTSLGKYGQIEYFLDNDFGSFFQLTVQPSGSLRLVPATYKDHVVPTGVFDATPDQNGWFLLATARGLLRFYPGDGRSESIPSPDARQEIRSLSRDGQGRLWASGDGIYISSDEGKNWTSIGLPMLSSTYMKRIRPNPKNPRGMIVAMQDRGVVFLEW